MLEPVFEQDAENAPVSDVVVIDENPRGATLGSGAGQTPDEGRYFSRSWKLLTRDKGSMKPVLLLALGLFVPVAGPFALSGFGLEWARLLSWGLEAVPKQGGAKVGACIKAGARAFVVTLVWGIAMGLVTVLLTRLLRNAGQAGSVITALWYVVLFVLGVMVQVAALRATIYQKVSAGLLVNRVWELVRREKGGFARLVWVRFLAAVLLCLAVIVAELVLALSALPTVVAFVAAIAYEPVGTTDGLSPVTLVTQLISSLLNLGPFLVLCIYAILFVGTLLALVFYGACGLWLQRLSVSSWGAAGDPLPVTSGSLSSASDPVPSESPVLHAGGMCDSHEDPEAASNVTTDDHTATPGA